MKFLFYLSFFLIVLATSILVSCGTTWSGKGELVQKYHVDGTDVYCKEEASIDTEEKDYAGKATCSFTAEKDGIIYECKNISLEALNKDFKFDASCKVVIDKSKEQTCNDPEIFDYG